ncbi:iron chaperone [Sporosarcina sp. P21c]|uniref:iron chaperone n=1 Tax=Sporosarcina TaxID=1569 RepID=UPI000A15507C|nr:MULTISPECIES: iron chaperone [Sporosarcina]ARJ37682.1 iron chaperone [Sporosarcina ureae]PIC66117.1 iron chaperone [Sporosarcina sp. P16a]PIC88648.1 iron chaperone [Sporosarcina sp. P21c]PIC91719.1 iron chaperone [Sporosarcina sp. P25]
MEIFKQYIAGIDSPEQRHRVEQVLAWVTTTFPNLEPQMKWNTPMFSDHGTFIIGISIAKHHMSISPEPAGIARFADEIAEAGYSATSGLFRIKWNEPIHFGLLEKLIEFNMEDKIDCTNFWRK